MATVTSGLEVPRSVFIDTYGSLTYEGASNRFIVDTSATAAMVGDVDGCRVVSFGWLSNHHHWQVQWRRRRRLSPAAAALLDSTTVLDYEAEGTDYWEPWPGSWDGNTLTDDEETACTWIMHDDGRMAFVTGGISVPYDFSEYDKWEYEVRVRAFNIRTLECSEWCYSDVLSVCFCPQFTAASANYTEDGAWEIEVDTTWPRDNNTLSLFRIMAGSTVNDILNGNDMFNGNDPRILFSAAWGLPYTGLPGDTFTISPTGKPTDEPSVAVQLKWFGTSDMDVPYSVTRPLFPFMLGTLHADTRAFLADVGAHIDPANIAGTVSATADGCALDVTVASTGSATPDAVVCRAMWTDVRGDPHGVNVELSTADSGATWTGSLDSVPFDTELTIRASLVASGSYLAVSTTANLPSNGLAVLSWPDAESVALKYDPDKSNDYSLNSEAVATAGRALPVSRYGAGGRLALSLTGRMLESESGVPAALAPLEEPHDWVVRYPGGEIYQAMLNGVSTSSSYSTGHDVVDVSISMEAVGYGLD